MNRIIFIYPTNYQDEAIDYTKTEAEKKLETKIKDDFINMLNSNEFTTNFLLNRNNLIIQGISNYSLEIKDNINFILSMQNSCKSCCPWLDIILISHPEDIYIPFSRIITLQTEIKNNNAKYQNTLYAHINLIQKLYDQINKSDPTCTRFFDSDLTLDKDELNRIIIKTETFESYNVMKNWVTYWFNTQHTKTFEEYTIGLNF